MKIVEYGKENGQVIILLHGGGLSWWNYREEANLLKENYHVILPVLQGHAECNTPFTTIEDNAKALIHYIDEHFGGRVLAIGGLSLGGQVLIEMLSQRSTLCEFAVIESALVIPRPMIKALIGPTLDMSYGLIKKEWFAKMQFKSLKMDTTLFKDYYQTTCKIQKQDMVLFLEANASYRIKPELADTTAQVMIVVGGKEQKIMQRSAEILQSTIPNSRLKILKQYFHGELSLNHPGEYMHLLTQLLLDK